MSVEFDKAGRFRVSGEEPPGFDQKTDQFGSAVAFVTEKPDTNEESHFLLVSPKTNEGVLYYQGRASQNGLENTQDQRVEHGPVWNIHDNSRTANDTDPLGQSDAVKNMNA